MKAMEDAYGGWALKRAQGHLLERNDRRGLHGDRIVRTCILVSKDGGVDTTREALQSSHIGFSSDPIVSLGLDSVQLYRWIIERARHRTETD